MKGFADEDVEELTAALAVDPYSMWRLAKLALLRLTTAPAEPACAQATANLARFPEAREISVLIDRCKRESLSVTRRNKLFLVSAAEGTREQELDQLSEISGRVREMWGHDLGVVVVDASGAALSGYVSTFDGIGLVRLSDRDRSPLSSGSVAHELTHALLFCGCPLIDEGVALYTERHLFGTLGCVSAEEARASDVELAQMAADTEELRGFLLEDSRSGFLFDGSQLDTPKYLLAWRFADHLVGTYGTERVSRLAAAIRDNPARSRVLAFREALQVSFDDLVARLGRGAARPTSMHLDDVEADLESDRQHGKSDAFDAHYGAMKGMTARSPRHREVVARMIVQKCATSKTIGAAEKSLLLHAQALLSELEGESPTARSLHTTGRCSVLQIAAASDGFEIATRAHAARTFFDRALELDPHFTEALIDRALLEFNTPYRYGRDDDLAAALLKRASVDTRFSREVEKAYARGARDRSESS